MEIIGYNLKSLVIESGLEVIKNKLEDNDLYYLLPKKYSNLLEITRRINNSDNKLTKVAIYSGNYTLKNDLTQEKPWFNIPFSAYNELKNYNISYIILSVICDCDDIQSYLLPLGVRLDMFLVKYRDMYRNRYVFDLSSLKKAIGKDIEGYILNEEQLHYFIESIKNVV